MQGAGELAEIEVRALALDGTCVGIHVERSAAAVGMADIHGQGEVGFVGAFDRFDLQLGPGLIDAGEDLAVAQRFGGVAWLAGTDFRVGQPDDLLADHRQGAGEADDQDEEPDGQGQPAVDEEPESGAGLFRHEANGRLGVVGTDHGLRRLDTPRSSI